MTVFYFFHREQPTTVLDVECRRSEMQMDWLPNFAIGDFIVSAESYNSFQTTKWSVFTSPHEIMSISDLEQTLV